MTDEGLKAINKPEELPDAWWHRIYLAVMVTTVLVIAALWGFTVYFSS